MEGHFAQGTWDEKQAAWHINKKEIAAARLTLLELCREALDLWQLVLDRGGWIFAYWVPRHSTNRPTC